MINLFATDVGKKSLNDESPEMNAAISRKKPGFVMMKQKVNKNHVNLQCAVHDFHVFSGSQKCCLTGDRRSKVPNNYYFQFF